MSRRVSAVRGGHHHLAWDAQPLVRSSDRPRGGYTTRALVAVFLLGLLIRLVV